MKKQTQCPECNVSLTIRKKGVKGDVINCVCTSCDRAYTRSVRTCIGGMGGLWGGALIKAGFRMEA